MCEVRIMEKNCKREKHRLILVLALIMCVKYSSTLKKSNESLLRRPNIIFIMADDLDVNLGSTDVLKKTKRLLQDEGVTFTNAFTTSPLCCPSRSSILTGRYAHNHNVNSNDKNCSGPAWIDGPEKLNFGKLLQDSGYVTAYFGKYLNNYNGDRVPPGWNHWSGLVRNSRFYNYSLNVNGKIVRYKNDYKKDYFTDVVTNASIDYFKNVKSQTSSAPIMMVLSMSAPHGPEDSAPQYQDSFKDVKAPRHPNYNYTSSDKHWIIRQTPPLDETTALFTDILYRKRLQTLLSVDDAIEKVYNMLFQEGLLDETYIIFTSDHGYHLGQFNQVKGKSQPYESDIRIPLFMRGPHIPKGVNISSIALNIDLAPTFLDIANANFPSFIDGTSLMDHAALSKTRNASKGKAKYPIQQIWKDTFLVERGKLKAAENQLRKPDKDLALKPVENVNTGDNKSANKMCQNFGFPMPPCTPNKKIICFFKNEVLHYEECLNETSKCNCKENTSKTTIFNVPLKSVENSTNIFANNEEHSKENLTSVNNQEFLLDSIDLNSFKKTDNPIEIDKFILHLKKRFEKLKRRIKRHEIKFMNRFSRSHANYESSIPSYAKNASEDDSTDDIELKIKRNKEKLFYWKNERNKLSTIAVYKSVASKVADHVKESSAAYLNSCLCSSKRKTKKKKVNENMNCFHMSKNHWKVPPLWTGPSFTACTNSPNSTYWCLRTINATHNFLYCEFITGFKEYFNVSEDPYQLHNIVSNVEPQKLYDLHRQLNYIRNCNSSHGCLLRAGRNMDDNEGLFKKWKRFERKKRQFSNSFGN
ncbi:extracellular sulfatase Sulf-2 isoform X3 [Hydra vulgaris]|uniref:Extracellular sulfatase Sulf-2 isoform X3 n=2 Tax=Hydra vulgaris TaxID=6087 RepID=A0ABM4BQI3_HYDVU